MSIGSRLLMAFEQSRGVRDKKEIAEILGFKTVGAVYKVVDGTRELDFEALTKFQNYTKWSIDWLLTGKGNKFFIENLPELLIQNGQLNLNDPRDIDYLVPIFSHEPEVWDYDNYFLSYLDPNIRELINEIAAKDGIHESGWTAIDTVNKLLYQALNNGDRKTNNVSTRDFVKDLLQEIVTEELDKRTGEKAAYHQDKKDREVDLSSGKEVATEARNKIPMKIEKPEQIQKKAS